jgi:hypothetical protein
MGGYNHPDLDTPENECDHRAIKRAAKRPNKKGAPFFPVRPLVSLNS